MKAHFLAAPDSQIDPAIKPTIEAWDDNEPTALQLLHTIDLCIYGGAASTFAVSALQALYDVALKREGKTHEDMEPLATWRADLH